MPKIPLPVTKRGKESDTAYLKRLMVALYGRACEPKGPLGRDGYRRAPKSVKAGE